MSVKTNELPELEAITGKDSILVDATVSGTGRVTADDLGEYYKSAFLPMGPGGVPYGKELTQSWTELQTAIKAGTYDGINIGDYKTITLTGGETVIMEVAGIDTYTRTWYPTEVPHHIDFISRDCLKGTKQWNTTATNNGTKEQHYPWLASALYKDLNETVFATLPKDLQAVIIPKTAGLEQRYSVSGSVSADTGWGDVEIGKLWLPSEVEVFGSTHWAESGYGTGGNGVNIQYPIFMGGAKHIIKGNGNAGARANWWEVCVRSGNATDVCNVVSAGNSSYASAASAYICAPLCFRIG